MCEVAVVRSVTVARFCRLTTVLAMFAHLAFGDVGEDMAGADTHGDPPAATADLIQQATTLPPAADTTGVAVVKASIPVPPPLPALWFPVGEELVYDIYWGVIPVGETRITTEWIQEDGRALLAIRYRTRSNKVIAKLYPVDDVIEAVIEPRTFLPVRFIKNLKEGSHRYHELTTFDHQNLKAHWRSLRSDKTKTFAIDPDTRDLVTLMYFLRSRPVREGEQYEYRVMADEKIYDLYLEAVKVESVKLDGIGRVPSMRIEPKAKFQGLFVRKGKMTVWVSRDARNLCTQVKASVPVADVNVVLREVRGPGDDQWVKRSPKD
ncbi:MAG: DUF3108 domain-containing protein [Lentisphaerae bacterium]|nr:DUF3108 domain-containing protein [Lentisphaerota bacterium]